MKQQLRRFLIKIKQKYCKHLMIPRWGLCRMCGYSDPNWTPEVYTKLMLRPTKLHEQHIKVRKLFMERAVIHKPQQNSVGGI